MRFGPWIGVSDGALHIPAGAEPPLFRPAIPQEIPRERLPPARSASRGADAAGRLANGRFARAPARLAAAVHLMENEGTILGDPGQRMVFGCSPGLKHHLPPDRSSLALTTVAELPRRWINVVRLEVARDWTWLGQADPAFRVRRTIRLAGAAVSPEVSELGTVGIAHTVNRQATQGAIDRDRMEFVFVDAFAPRVVGDRPYEIEVSYEVTAELANGTAAKGWCDHATAGDNAANAGPACRLRRSRLRRVLSRPRTIPRRDRGRAMLWMEFAEPVKDERDTYFVRVLASTPDPMLLPATTPAPDPIGYEQSELDPELVRVIRPGQSDDFAGLTAGSRSSRLGTPIATIWCRCHQTSSMQANDLFGFFTYEITVGHARAVPGQSFWSTAQGRYGPASFSKACSTRHPLIVCDARRVEDQLVASAEFAEPILSGRRLTPSPPNTDLWLVLYCQVHQADGQQPQKHSARPETGRANAPGRPTSSAAQCSPQRFCVHPSGYAAWTKQELKDLLARYGLPEDMPLSVLAVETLPEPNGWFDDPLGGDLGQVRILRTSSLTAIEIGCCVS